MADSVSTAALFSTSSSPDRSAHISSLAMLSPCAHRLRYQSLLSARPRRLCGRRMPDGFVAICLASSGKPLSRRDAVNLAGAYFGVTLLSLGLSSFEKASASQFADMPALRGKDYGKSKMNYPDYIMTTSGLQYKDLREGAGPNPQEGDQVMVDWAGYTIGYYGRIFEARNKPKGSSFEGNERDYFRFKLGGDEVIPAFEEAIKTMRVGGVRRLIVPADIGYPNDDYNAKGPKPATFSGQRALDFVLRNQGLIDKTLLFDIELLKIVEK